MVAITDVKIGDRLYAKDKITPQVDQVVGKDKNGRDVIGKVNNYLIGKVTFIDTHGRWVTVDTGPYKTTFWLDECFHYYGQNIVSQLAAHYGVIQ